MSRRSLSSGSSGRSWPSWWCPWSALGCPPTISVNHDDHALDGRHAACRVRGDPAARRRPHELVVGTPSCPRPLCTRAVRSPVAVLIHTPRQFHLRWWPAWSHPSTRGSSCPTPPAATSPTERPSCPSGRGGLLRRPRQRHLNRLAVGPRHGTTTHAVVPVRQNLDLLVDNGQPGPGLSATDTTQWGATLGNEADVRLVAQGGSPLGGVGGAQPGTRLAVVHQQVEVLPHGHDGVRRGAVSRPHCQSVEVPLSWTTKEPAPAGGAGWSLRR